MGVARSTLGAAFAALLLSVGGASAGEAGPPVVLSLDTPTAVNGVDVVCTGIGRAIRDDPRWAAYPVRVEVSNARSEYLLSADLVVRDKGGRSLVNVHCDAPWLLLRPSPGAYRVEAKVPGVAASRSAPFSPPSKGQIRVVLQFPDA